MKKIEYWWFVTLGMLMTLVASVSTILSYLISYDEGVRFGLFCSFIGVAVVGITYALSIKNPVIR